MSDAILVESQAELEAEVREILSELPHIVIRRDGLGWLIGCGRFGIEYSGHTGSGNTPDDPRDLARYLWELARPKVLEPAPEPESESEPEFQDGRIETTSGIEIDEPISAQSSSQGVLVDRQRTETTLFNLREEPMRLVRAHYESSMNRYIGDQDARAALHRADSADTFRTEKLEWIAEMDAVLEAKLTTIQNMDGIALANYRDEATGWPSPE